MQLDSMFFLNTVKKVTDEEDEKRLLIEWHNLATLLCLQTNGCAASNSLITRLNTLFAAVMQTIANLDSLPSNKELCQVLFQQIRQFYQDLNNQTGHSEEYNLQQWKDWSPCEPPATECFMEELELSEDCKSEFPCMTQDAPSQTISSSLEEKLKFNKYD